MRSLGVILKIRILFCFEPGSHIDLVRVVDWSSYSCCDVSPLRMPALEEDHVCKLAHERTGEMCDTDLFDALLYLCCDPFRLFFGYWIDSVELLGELRLLNQLSYDRIPVPVHQMPVRCPDPGHARHTLPVKRLLHGVLWVRACGSPHGDARPVRSSITSFLI